MRGAKGAGGAVAAGGHDLQLALDLRVARQVPDVGLGEIPGEHIGAAAGQLEIARQDQVAQLAHLVRPRR